MRCIQKRSLVLCGSPPEQESGLPVPHPEDDVVKQGSRPTSCVPTDVKVNAVKSERKNNIFIKKGRVNGKDVRILLDMGASTNRIKPGLASTVLLSRRLQAQRFDGTLTPLTDVKHVEAPVSMDGHFFPTMEFVEWKLSESHDIIFGKPWFEGFNPQVNWQTEEVVIPERMQFMVVDGHTFTNTLNAGECEQVFRVKLQIVPDLEVIPELIRKVVAEEFKDVFPEQLPDGLPPMREVNFELTLKKGAQPSTRAPFRMSKMEQDAFEEFVKDKLRKGWIEVSNSPWVSNIFAIPKKDPVTGRLPKRAEWLRWVFDYRYLSSVTVITKIPWPLIEERFDKMVGCDIYTLIDLAQGYHQMRVVKSSRQYTAFRTHKETYQWCVAPMGVAGMSGTWSRLMHALFDKFEFGVVYLDDTCIFSKNMEEHCLFGQTEVAFLGHMVSHAGISVDPRKTGAIAKYPTPTNRKELLGFLGLAGYYRRFIYDFAELSRPLKHRLRWNWSKPVEEGYLHLKLALQQASTLRLPDFERPFIVTTDASGHCIGGVLSQKYDGTDHPIVFYSKKLDVHERGLPTHEKELLAIKVATEKWSHYLHGRPFDVYTDNSACSWMLHRPRVSP
ncbi:Pol protein [Phytophthora palmivora]|uniref:Pol protein n=1 Tax=Phytophthora palmivora TaxID=4796 RepID=A0A2P4XW84_9STRA|nr:Pol protein [Phytophthora palmivora]